MFSNEDESSPIQNDPDTDYVVHSITAADEDIAYGLYTKLIGYENHYNLLQNRYKNLALTWLLSTFIAIGYLISGQEEGLPLNILLAIMILGFLASIGIFLLWFLDTGVYHKLIESIFHEILILEEKYPIVGKYHHNILKLHEAESDPQKFHGLYYSYSIFSLLIISTICLAAYLYQVNVFLLLIILGLLIIASVIFVIIHRKPVDFHKKK